MGSISSETKTLNDVLNLWSFGTKKRRNEETKKPRNHETTRPRNQQARNKETKKPRNPETKKPNKNNKPRSQATKKPRNQEAKKPKKTRNQEAKEPRNFKMLLCSTKGITPQHSDSHPQQLDPAKARMKSKNVFPMAGISWCMAGSSRDWGLNTC